MSALPRRVDQMMQTLSSGPLKAAPGSMSVDCSDCFTVTEALAEAATGKSYVRFMQDEILTPVGMANTCITTRALPPGSFARGPVKCVVQSPEFPNVLVAVGIFSAAKDLARIVMMYLGNGAVGPTRIVELTRFRGHIMLCVQGVEDVQSQTAVPGGFPSTDSRTRASRTLSLHHHGLDRGASVDLTRRRHHAWMMPARYLVR